MEINNNITALDEELYINDIIESEWEKEIAKAGLGICVEKSFHCTGEVLAKTLYEVELSIFGNVTKVGNIKEVIFYSKTIKNLIDSFPMTIRRKASVYIVRHLVRHELGHCRQILFNKKMLMKNRIDDYIIDSFNGYGNREEEKDANRYAALELPSSKFGKLIYELMEINQLVIGLAIIPNDLCKVIRKLQLKLIGYSLFPFLAN